MKRIILFAVVLSAIMSCTKSPVLSYDSNPDAVKVSASVGAITRSNPLGDGGAQTQFNVGDRIRITDIGTTASAVYVKSNSGWEPEDRSKFLTWSKGTIGFRAEYPADMGDILPADQSSDKGIASADRMQCATHTTSIPEDRTLNLELNRTRSLVIVKIDSYKDQFSTETDVISNFVIRSDDGKYSGNAMDITPYVRNSEGALQLQGTSGTIGFTYSAIVASGVGYQDEAFIKLTIAGEELEVRGIPSLEAGKAYIYSLVVGKELIKTAVTVIDWDESYQDVTGNDGEAEWDRTKWNGSVADGFAGGDGSAASPYLIEDASQLAYLAQQVNNGNSYAGKYISLIDDIYLSGHEWTPIGAYNEIRGTFFSGNFEGNGKIVYGLKVAKNWPCRGLFGYVWRNAANEVVIRNLIIKDAYVKGGCEESAKSPEFCVWGAGILCGVAVGNSAGQNVAISNCHVSGQVECEDSNGGGLIGYAMACTISGCTSNNVTVTGGSELGGLVGYACYANSIKSCEVTGRVSGTNNIGGLIGALSNANSSNGVNLEILDCISQFTVTGSRNVGGIVGYLAGDDNGRGEWKTINFSNCSAYGDIDVTKAENVGGIVGFLNCRNLPDQAYEAIKLSNCKYLGTISATEETSNLGGIIGRDVLLNADISTSSYDSAKNPTITRAVGNK